PAPRRPSRRPVPVGIDRMVVHRRAPRELRAHARLDPGGTETFRGDVTLYDEDGAFVASLEGVRIRRAPRESFTQAPTAAEVAAYGIEWQKKARGTRAATPPSAPPGRRWLIFSDAAGVGASLAEKLVERGDMVRCT